MRRNEFAYSMSTSLDMLTELGNDYRRIFYGKEINELLTILARNYDHSLVMRLVLVALSQVGVQNGQVKSEIVEEKETRDWSELSEEEKEEIEKAIENSNTEETSDKYLRILDSIGWDELTEEEKKELTNRLIENGYLSELIDRKNIDYDQENYMETRFRWTVSKNEEGHDRKIVPYTSILSSLGFYNDDKSELPWCDCFTDALFLMATRDIERAESLLCQEGERKHGAASNYSYEYYRSNGQIHSPKEEAKIGDQIFFYDGSFSSIVHTGIVIAVDDEYVYTVEGNTLCDKFVEDLVHSQAGINEYSEQNGYGIFLKRYRKGSNKIAGYGRPSYREEEQITPAGEKLVNDIVISIYEVLESNLQPKYPEFGTHSDYDVSNQSRLSRAKNKFRLKMDSLKTRGKTLLENKNSSKEELRKRQEELNELLQETKRIDNQLDESQIMHKTK